MRTKTEIISLLTDPGIVAIVRAQKAAQVVPLFEALIAGGIKAIEITVAIEKKFKISVRDEDVPRIVSVKQAVDLVERLLAQGPVNVKA